MSVLGMGTTGVPAELADALYAVYSGSSTRGHGDDDIAAVWAAFDGDFSPRDHPVPRTVKVPDPNCESSSSRFPELDWLNAQSLGEGGPHPWSTEDIFTVRGWRRRESLQPSSNARHRPTPIDSRDPITPPPATGVTTSSSGAGSVGADHGAPAARTRYASTPAPPTHGIYLTTTPGAFLYPPVSVYAMSSEAGRYLQPRNPLFGTFRPTTNRAGPAKRPSPGHPTDRLRLKSRLSLHGD